MIKLNDYAYSSKVRNKKLWFKVSFTSEDQWIRFWNNASTGTFIHQLGEVDGRYRYVPGTCPDLDEVLLPGTGFPKSITFKTDFEGLLTRN